MTLSVAVAAGVFLVVAAHRLRLPAIVLLLFGGMALGPQGVGWIDPAVLGRGLESVISLAVAVILFEGGLTLDIQGYKRAQRAIRRLLSAGALITWLGTAAAVYWLFDLSAGMALMAGSLVIVTGPTVVSPLLRRLRLKERVHHVLYWEAVLIDAIGGFVAVLCYEWLTPDAGDSLFGPLGRFGLRLLVGLAVGLAAGFAVTWPLKHHWIAKHHVNIFVLAAALLTFGVAGAILSEAGILSVVVAGLVVALNHPPQLKLVKGFKLQLTELGIGTLFVLLAAKLELARFLDWRVAVLVAVVIMVLRPLAVVTATWGQAFSARERAFLSWLAPRGIVAAALASLFSLRLTELGLAGAEYLETFTYAIIATTVTVQGLTAGWVARLLGLVQHDGRTWVLLGDAGLVEAIGRGLRRAGIKVVVAVESAGAQGSDDGWDTEEPAFADASAVLCAHTATLRNVWAANRWATRLGSDACFRWATLDQPENGDAHASGRVVWRGGLKASMVAAAIDSGSHAIEVLDLADGMHDGRFGPAMLPLFWVDNGRAQIVVDPSHPGVAQGELAVVLKKRIAGLAGLIEHVEVIDEREPTFEAVVRLLGNTAQRLHPDVALAPVVEGIIARREILPATVGGGMAIPHAYTADVEHSHCVLGVVRHGVADMETADGVPVRLVFLLVSPLGRARDHLASLAALAALGQEREFIELLCRQRVPERIAQLIRERA